MAKFTYRWLRPWRHHKIIKKKTPSYCRCQDEFFVGSKVESFVNVSTNGMLKLHSNWHSVFRNPPIFFHSFPMIPIGYHRKQGKKSEHVFMLDKALDHEFSRNQIHTQLLLGGSPCSGKAHGLGFCPTHQFARNLLICTFWELMSPDEHLLINMNDSYQLLLQINLCSDWITMVAS